MSNELDDLIIQLKSLCLRHKQILEQLEQTVAEEGQVIRRIEAQQEALTPTRPSQYQHITPTRTPFVSKFAVGERVYIDNEVKQRRGQPPVSQKDRRATVTKIDPENPCKIFIVTDNNFHTWRLQHHLKHLSSPGGLPTR